VQANVELDPDRPCQMDLRVLLHGGSFRISEDRWRHARSCLRDPRGLAQAVQQLETHLERQAPGDGAEPAGRHRLRRGGAAEVPAEPDGAADWCLAESGAGWRRCSA
jgi:hypothetical protein